MIKMITMITILFFVISGNSFAEQSILEKYKDRYSSLDLKEKSSIKKVEEFFSYNCNYCYESNKSVKIFLKNKHNDVIFERNQVNADIIQWTHSQVMFIAAKIAGVGDQLHDPLFKYLHVDEGSFDTFQDVLNFLRKLKLLDQIEPYFFSDQFYEMRTNISKKIKIYGVNKVPLFIINGSYRLEWGTDMTPEEFSDLVNAILDL